MQTVRRKKTKSRPGRFEYLGLLINEFSKTTSRDARLQVLANLANFAYDPNNYHFFRELKIVDLFLTHLSDIDETVVQFSIGGLCNLCLDTVNKYYILKSDGVKSITKLLELQNENILISAITTLIFLITPESKAEITNPSIIKHMINFREQENRRLKNLAEVFLQDYCCKELTEETETNLSENLVEDIPLPNS